MNQADIDRARKTAQHAQKRAETQAQYKDFAIAAGFYRNAAALWRLAKDERNALICDQKADELERK
jgi:hypothetical protein